MRSRNLKPGFFKNPELAELPFQARLLFAGLWCMADREGRLEDRSSKIKMEVFPADSLDVEDLLDRLHNKRLIQRYEVGKVRCIQVMEFLKHQHPHQKEPPSTLPKSGAGTGLTPGATPVQHQTGPGLAPDMPGAGTGVTRLIPSSLIPDSGFLIPESPLRIPDTRAPESRAGHEADQDVPRGTPAEIFDGVAFFRAELKGRYPTEVYTDDDERAAGRSIEVIVSESLGTEVELIANTMGFAKQQKAAGNEGTRFVMNPRKFFAVVGGGGHWRGPFPIAKAQQKPTPERPRMRSADEIEAEERARVAG